MLIKLLVCRFWLKGFLGKKISFIYILLTSQAIWVRHFTAKDTNGERIGIGVKGQKHLGLKKGLKSTQGKCLLRILR